MTIADTPSGAFKGLQLDDLTVFGGVPFAEPPVGPLRFAVPQRVAPHVGVLDATVFGNDPIQADAASDISAYTSTPRPASGEDCLRLNVWTPDVTGTRPVLVFLFGGGFEGGSASPPLFPGERLARSLDCVIVGIPYRLGALGWLHVPSVSGGSPEQANLGLQDQAAGLRWVRDNISALGGDPQRVTLAGTSAGAYSAGTLLTFPMAKGTFQRAILSSGSDQRVYPAETAAALTRDFMTAAGAANLEDLRALDTTAILQAQKSVTNQDVGHRNLVGGRAWGIVLDGHVVDRHPHERVRDGEARDVTLLVSTTHDEVQMWAQRQPETFAPADLDALLAEMQRAGMPEPDALIAGYRAAPIVAGTEPSLADLRSAWLTDCIWRGPALRLITAHRNAGGRGYSYEFTDAPMGDRLGACHGVDMLYVLDALAVFGVTDSAALAVRDQLVAAWRGIVHDADPGWDPAPAIDTGKPGGRQSVTRHDAVIGRRLAPSRPVPAAFLGD